MTAGKRGFLPLLARGLLGLLVAVPWAGAVAQAPGAPPGRHPCTCRAHGRSYGLGERACILSPAGWRIAECRMAQNVTSWALSGEACEVSAGRGLPPGRAGSRAAAVAGSPGNGKGGG